MATEANAQELLLDRQARSRRLSNTKRLSEQLSTVDAQKRFDPSLLEATLSQNVQFNAAATRRRRNRTSTNKDRLAYLEQAQNRGSLAPEQAAELRNQLLSLTALAAETNTLREKLLIQRTLETVNKRVSRIQLTEEQRREVDELREWVWRAVDDGLAALGPESFGLGTVGSYAVTAVRYWKTLRYRGQNEPVGMSYLFTPPGYKFNSDDFKERMIALVHDGGGLVVKIFFGVALLCLLLIGFIILVALATAISDPLSAALNPGIRSILDSIGQFTLPIEAVVGD